MKQEELKKYLAELKELTDIESPTASVEGVNSVAKWFMNKAGKLGLKHETVALGTDKVADCLLISNNPNAEKFDVLFVAHMDTVFPVGSVQNTPFTQNESRVNALGVIDDKGGALLSLYVIKELDLSKINVALFLNSHEETGSNFAKEKIREYARKSKFCLVMEPAREDGSMVATRKGVMTYVIDFHGVGAHAGNHAELGRSAVVEAANFVVELSKLTDFAAGHTFNSIITNGGTAHNVVPEFASVTCEMRYKFASSVEFFNKKLDEILSKPFINGVTHKKTLINEEAPMIDEQNLPRIKAVFDEVAKETGTKVSWVDAGGLSDGNITASAGCPTIDGLGPTGGNMHTKNEYMDASSVVPKCNLVLDVIKKLV